MFEDGEKPRIFVEESICNGCHMCEMMCSFVNTQSFYPGKANIKVINYEWKGRNKPVISCDVETHSPCRTLPQCVRYCPTGALVWATKDEFASMLYEHQRGIEANPSYKARAPWCRR
jgi:Fe-S-cluster-containing hydrogenase component 2